MQRKKSELRKEKMPKKNEHWQMSTGSVLKMLEP
jgi:hypothetical protein